MKVAHTFFFHSGPKAFLKPTVSALVPLVFIHYALSAESVNKTKKRGTRLNKLILEVYNDITKRKKLIVEQAKVIYCRPARVHVVFANAASEETLAAITAGGSIVFSCCPVTTDSTQSPCAQVIGSIQVGTLSWRGV